MSAPKKKHRISSVLEFIGRTIFYLALLGNGAQANLPTSSISNLKPLFRNETLCAINTCDALCSTDSGQPPGAASNIKIPNAAVMANATFDDFDESSPIKVDMAGVANRTRRPQKRTLIPVPELCDRRQYVRVLSNFVARERQWVRHDRGGNESRTTTGAWAFPDSGKSAVGVDELTGCTAVAVISSKGVFLSHSWESPFFRTEEGEEQDDESFLGYTYNAILEGNLVGLRALTARGRILSAEYQPAVFIISVLSNDLDRAMGITTPFAYQREIELLRDNLHQFLGREPELVGYTRRRSTDIAGNGIVSSRTRPYAGWAGRAIVEFDVEDSRVGSDDSPSESWIGKWRLWVEDRRVQIGIFVPGQ